MQILKAKYILPITADPVENGGIVIEEPYIKEIGYFEDLEARYPYTPVKDLGDSILMPGFVNVHSHAEYTVLGGLTGAKPFFDWIVALTQYHEYLTHDEFISSAKLGILRMLSSGITSIADSACYGTTLEVLANYGLKGIVYQEVFGPDDHY
ncbi:amidohydrolase family protein, partial [bacterium]|nr:amidohydrolase family protein [bacterium]